MISVHSSASIRYIIG